MGGLAGHAVANDVSFERGADPDLASAGPDRLHYDQVSTQSGFMTSLAEDRDQIRDLFARYCLYVDSGAADEWASMFTEDAKFLGGGEAMVGRDVLRNFAAGLPAGTMHHMVTNLAIDVHGDTATCHSSVLVTVNGALMITGRSVDELRRVDGGWLIAHRDFTADATP